MAADSGVGRSGGACPCRDATHGGSRPSAFTRRRLSSREPAMRAALTCMWWRSPSAWRSGASRSTSSPGRSPATSRRWPSWPRACWSGTWPPGPFEDLDKSDLPGQLCQFTFELLRTEAAHAPGRYDLVHGHYWLSGQVGAVAKERWGVPLVQSMHTLGKVKNAALAAGDAAEPEVRLRGEAEVVAAADRLVANTDDEARQLIGRLRRRPGPGGDHQPRRRPVGLPARLAGGRPASGWACPPTGSCWCSPGGSSRSRPRTSCCTRRPG